MKSFKDRRDLPVCALQSLKAWSLCLQSTMSAGACVCFIKQMSRQLDTPTLIVQTTRLISSSKRLECNLVVRRQRDCVYFRDVRHPDLGGWHVSSKNELSVVSADPARNIFRRYSLSHGHYCKGIVARALLHEHNRIDFVSDVQRFSRYINVQTESNKNN